MKRTTNNFFMIDPPPHALINGNNLKLLNLANP